ncbi:alpha-ribazole phosphatase family protein [Henriciella aquimarina]|uniref:alpha-ribazole phosphatase family protein n=1 Tax=Henriciella aquimarina TaxID=545261 RepID=UPI000A01D04B|nr:alpha-ribazole phosphatase family protein [Henriciella aquimarina]
MAVTLLRHTQPAAEPGLCYGASDLTLAASFPDEAEALIPALPATDRIVTSPLFRCRVLAERLSGHFGCRLNEDPRLKEMDFGQWEGRPWADIPPVEINAWASDFLQARPHGGESVAMLRKRTLEALEEYRSLDGHTLIVTHAGVIKAALAADETAESHAASIGFSGFVTLID